MHFNDDDDSLMTNSRRYLLFYLAVSGLVCSEKLLIAQENEQQVLVHYMPWYASKPFSGHWGWHWTMGHFDPEQIDENGQREIASQDAPLIGPYDSNDPDLLEYHVLLMKLAGIDGVIIDWYGIRNFRDYGEIHRNTQHLIQHLKRAGLKFAICYEDQTVKHLVETGELPAADALNEGKKTLTWLEENWFSDDSYVQINDRPVLLVFGPQYFETQQWRSLLAASPSEPLIFGLPHLADKMQLHGAFGWPPVAGNRTIDKQEWQQYLTTLYARSNPSEAVIAVAFPGFHDIYEQAKLHPSYGFIDAQNGATFRATLTRAMRSNASLIQITTWNDFGEGTVIEPTRKHDYEYLEFVQQQTSAHKKFTADDLRLPARLYQLRKKFTEDKKIAQLNHASELLSTGQLDHAIQSLSLLREVNPVIVQNRTQETSSLNLSH